MITEREERPGAHVSVEGRVGFRVPRGTRGGAENMTAWKLAARDARSQTLCVGNRHESSSEET